MSRDFWSIYQNRLNQNGTNQKDRLITNAQRTIINQFSNSPSYQIITINGTSQEVQITDENSLYKNPNKKRLLCKPDENINTGDLVVWDSENWLCTDVDDLKIYKRGIIEKCNNSLKYLDSTGDIVTIQCIVTDRILMNAKENDYYILPDNEIWVVVDSNSDATSIITEQRFILNGNAFKVKSIPDNVTKPGLIVLKMCSDAINENDYVTGSICDYYNNLHVYSVSILNGNSVQMTLNSSLQLELECKDNDTVVTNPTVNYSLVTGSTSFISISTSGLVSGALIGSGSIIVNYASSTDNININIVTAATATYTYALLANIEPSNEIKYNQTKSYVAHKYYSTGTDVTGSQFTFAVTLNTGASSSNYLLTSSDTIANLKCLEYPYSISLIATDQADVTQSITQVISLKGLI